MPNEAQLESDVQTVSVSGGGGLRRQAAAVLMGLLVLAVAGVYRNAIATPFIFDDEPKIVKNPDIKELGAVWTKLIYPYHPDHRNIERNDPSRPIAFLTFAVNYHFGGLDPRGYHLVNIFLHALNVLLVFLVSRRLVALAFGEERPWLAFAASLLFALHPVNTEVVTYIHHRGESLAALFFLSAFLAFLEAHERSRGWLVAAIGCFILALLSKPTAITLPIVLLLADFLFLCGADPRAVWKRRARHLPFWIVAVAYVAFRLAYLGQIGDAETPTHRWTSLSYATIQPYVLARYLITLAWPDGLCADHLIRPATGLLDPRVFLPFVVLVGLGAGLVLLYRRNTPATRYGLFAALWFLVVLAPTSSVVPINDAMAERRIYLPSVGFYWLALLGGRALLGPAAAGVRRWLPGAVLGLAALALGATTVDRNRVYADPVRFWNDILASYPTNARARSNLGNLHYFKGDYDAAIREYLEAIAADDSFGTTRTNLGDAYFQKGDYERAAVEYEAAIGLDPNHVEAYHNLGTVYYSVGRSDEAIALYRKAIEIRPSFVLAHRHLAAVYRARGQMSEALAEYRRAAALDPDAADLRRAIAEIEGTTGR